MTLVSHREDSPPGGWTLVTHRPHHLAGLVEGIWCFTGVTAHRRERHAPTGTLDLIVQLDGGNGPYRIVEGSPRGAAPAVSIGGQLVGPLVIEAPSGPSRVLGVRLRPAGGFAVLGLPLHELTGLTVDLVDLLGSEARELAERCAAGPSDGHRVRIAEGWLTDRIRRSRGLDASVSHAAALIEGEGGRTPVGALPERVGASRTRLTRTFKEQIGVTPKLFARIVRFRSLAADLRNGPRPLVELALSRGYYDQPHMNAEFREMSGLSPRAFLAAARYPGATSVVE